MGHMPDYLDLSSRERQIMEAVFRLKRATVSEIRAALPDPPTPPAVRTMLARLEDKGCLRHTQEHGTNVYMARAPLARARRSAIHRMMQTFFEGSPVKTVASILDESAGRLSADELEELARHVERARKGGR